MPSFSLGSILDDFLGRWQRGEAPRAEEYLSRLQTSEDAVELIYREFCLAEAAGLNPEPSDYLSRFSHLQQPLGRLLDLHDAISVSQLRAWTEPAVLPVAGDEIGPYHLERELGRGAFARVFLARQTDLDDRHVVVKVSIKVTPEPRLLARSQHPNIVAIHWHGIVNDGEFQLICMPFHGGGTLSDVLADLQRAAKRPRSGRDLLAALDRIAAPEYHVTGQSRSTRETLGVLPYAQALGWIIARLADALDHAYRRGVAHGDIKTSNILLTADGDPKLLDFNLAVGWRAHSVNDTLEDVGGTLAYMAPERLKIVAGADHTTLPRAADRHRADLYGLGIVFLEALSGRPPIAPEDRPRAPKELAQALASIRLQGSDVLVKASKAAIPATLRSILTRCLAPEPADRYGRSSELAHDLDCWINGRPLVYARQPILGFQVRHRLRQWGLVGALVLVVALGAFALQFWDGMQRAARARALTNLLAYYDQPGSGVFRFRSYDAMRVIGRDDPAEVAKAHLAHFGLLDSDDWNQRESFRDLPRPIQEDLQLWLYEQVLRFAHAAGKPGVSSDEKRRALGVVERAIARTSASPLETYRLRFRRELGLPDEPTPTAAEGAVRAVDEYLLGILDELEQHKASDEQVHYRKLLNDRPRSFWGHYRMATVAYRLHDFGAAVDHMKECIEQLPGSPDLRAQLAGCLYGQGRFAEALEACDRALAINPDHPEPYRTRSYVRRRMGQAEGSANDLKKFRELARKNTHLTLGESRLISLLPNPRDVSKDDSIENTDLPRRILAVDPDDLDARRLLATQLMLKGEMKEALEQAEELLRANPNFLWALYARANASMSLSRGNLRPDLRANADRDLAALLSHPRLEEFLHDYPQGLGAYQLSVWSSLERKDVQHAEQVALAGLEQAARLGVQKGDMHFTLARVYGLQSGSDPALLLKTFQQLCLTLSLPTQIHVLDRFEHDPAFVPCRAKLRLLLNEAFPFAPYPYIIAY